MMNTLFFYLRHTQKQVNNLVRYIPFWIMRNFWEWTKWIWWEFRIHLSCVCAYTSLEGGDFSFVTNKYFLGPAKTALTIFFKLCIPPFLGLKNFVLGFLRFKNWSIRPKIRPESGFPMLNLCGMIFFFDLYSRTEW